METSVQTLVHSELSEPAPRVIRSDGALYLVLLLGAVGCIALSRWLSDRFGLLRIWFQIGLYAGLLGTGYAIYRLRLVGYRYLLTDRELRIDQVVGKKIKPLLTVPLDNLIGEGPGEEGASDGRTYTGRRRDAFCVRYRTDAGVRRLYLSCSETLRSLISEHIHA